MRTRWRPVEERGEPFHVPPACPPSLCGDHLTSHWPAGHPGPGLKQSLAKGDDTPVVDLHQPRSTSLGLGGASACPPETAQGPRKTEYKGFVCSHGRGGEYGSWPTTPSFPPFPEHHWFSFLLFPLFPDAPRVRVHPLGVLLIPSPSFQTHPVPLLLLPAPFHYHPVPHHVYLILRSYFLQNSLWSSG